MASGQKLAGKKILLVEDDAFLSDVIAQKLVNSKCIFSHVLNGEDALNALEKEVPDLVLLDILLPGKIDGFGVLEKMRASHELKGVPVIILSNLGRPEDIEKGMKLGAFRYLVKASIVPNEIVEHLELALP